MGLGDFTRATFPGYADAPHQDKLNEALEALERRDIDRLIVTMPPRHGKSEKVSVRFPAWYLGRHPDHQIICASYAAPLAHSFSRAVRNLIADSELYPPAWQAACGLAPDSKSVAHWRTTRGGGMRAVGVAGGATGHGAHLLNIDDYLKNDQDAASELIREKQWQWYASTARTRLMPHGVITITATRWHEDDLIGRILNQPGAHARWYVLELPAIAGWPDAIGQRLPTWPPAGDVLGRADGAALWPAWYPAEVLAEIKADVGSRVFAALYNCRPAAAEGNVIRRAWLSKRYRELPPLTAVWLSVDASYKAGVGSDYSAIATWGTDGVNYYLIDCWRGRVEFPELKRAMADAWTKWTATLGAVVHGMLVEDAANGTPAIQELRRETSVPLVAVRAVTSKVARIESVAPLFEAGKVYLPDGAPWLSDWVEEHAGMPNVTHDDMVDTTSQALARLSGRGTPGWLTYVHQRAATAADVATASPAQESAPGQRVSSAASGFLTIARREFERQT